MVEEHREPRDRRVIIYILPNLVTTASLCCGFIAILSAIQGKYINGAMLIFLSMIFDGLDGRVARWTKTESEFGVQYDSLADLVAFGVAPALLVHQWSLTFANVVPVVPSRLGAMAAFIYVACTALRLARFNVQVGEGDKRYFSGLPSPSAAAIMAGFVWVAQYYGWSGKSGGLLVLSLLITLLCASAMVCDLKYYSFKTFKLQDTIPFNKAVLPVLVIGLIVLKPSLTLFSIFACYGLHAPLLALWRRWRRRK